MTNHSLVPRTEEEARRGRERKLEVNGPGIEQVSAFFLWLHPHSTTGTVGAWGEGLAKFQALFLESFPWTGEAGKTRGAWEAEGRSIREGKRLRKKEKGKQEQRGSWRDIRKNAEASSASGKQTGAIFRRPWLAIICARGEKGKCEVGIVSGREWVIRKERLDRGEPCTKPSAQGLLGKGVWTVQVKPRGVMVFTEPDPAHAHVPRQALYSPPRTPVHSCGCARWPVSHGTKM